MEKPVDTNDWPIFKGYKFDQNGNVIEENKKDESQSYQFDEAGVVISTEATKNEVSSPFKFDENGIVIETIASIANEDPVEILTTDNSDSAYQFDEAGVVIDVHDKPIENQGYIFDENGFVVKAI